MFLQLNFCRLHLRPGPDLLSFDHSNNFWLGLPGASQIPTLPTLTADFLKKLVSSYPLPSPAQAFKDSPRLWMASRALWDLLRSCVWNLFPVISPQELRASARLVSSTPWVGSPHSWCQPLEHQLTKGKGDRSPDSWRLGRGEERKWTGSIPGRVWLEGEYVTEGALL